MIFSQLIIVVCQWSSSMAADAVRSTPLPYVDGTPHYHDGRQNFTEVLHASQDFRHVPTRHRVARPGGAIEYAARVQLSGRSMVSAEASPQHKTDRAKNDRTRRTRRRTFPGVGRRRRRRCAGRPGGRQPMQSGTSPAARGGPRWSVERPKRSTSEATNEHREFVLHSLNEVRRKVQPRAANMLLTVWSGQLEALAKEWASQCVFGRGQPKTNMSLGQKSLGQTFWAGKVRWQAIKLAMAAWIKEGERFFYDDPLHFCPDSLCGNFSQMVWATSEYVGCASALCHTLRGDKYRTNYWFSFVVCYYSPSRVYGGQPYIPDQPCSHCPDDRLDCTYRLCAATPKCKPVTECAQSSLAGSPYCLCGAEDELAQLPMWKTYYGELDAG